MVSLFLKSCFTYLTCRVSHSCTDIAQGGQTHCHLHHLVCVILYITTVQLVIAVQVGLGLFLSPQVMEAQGLSMGQHSAWLL